MGIRIHTIANRVKTYFLFLVWLILGCKAFVAYPKFKKLKVSFPPVNSITTAFDVINFNDAMFFSGALSIIPLSIIIDSVFQQGNKRIEKISNTKIVDQYNREVFAYISLPENATLCNEKFPVVILVHQFFGLRPRDTELCDELARLGYVAVAPDCYQGNTTALIPRAIYLVKNAAFKDDWNLPLTDMDRVVNYLSKQPYVNTSKIAVCGFCFGGGVALRYADTHPDKGIQACGVFYGKPISKISGLNSRVYGVFGERDRQFPPAMVDSFEKLLVGAGLTVEFRRYRGKAHAFIEDLNCIKKGGDAGDAWSGWISFLKDSLQ